MEKLKLTKRAFFSKKFDDYHNAKIYYTSSKQNTTTELAIGIKETNITLERRALDCPNITKHVNNTVWQTRGFLNDRRSPYSLYNSSLRTYPSESLVLVVWGWPSSSSSPSSGTRVPTITSVYKSPYIIVNTFFFQFFFFLVTCHLKVFQNHECDNLVCNFFSVSIFLTCKYYTLGTQRTPHYACMNLHVNLKAYFNRCPPLVLTCPSCLESPWGAPPLVSAHQQT